MVVDAMPTVSAARAALRDLLGRARDRARGADRPVLASLVAPAPPLDPLAAFAGAAALAAERVYWERPAEGLALVGVGAAWE
ncbi:MAG: isochorismate synthase, partial [Thermomicrobiaceae bacterium]|nr:isochorismate synthase [Thermomicrobiaceae bacterium]